MKNALSLLCLLLLCLAGHAQPWMQTPYLQTRTPGQPNFYEIQQAFWRYEAETIQAAKRGDTEDEEGHFPGYMRFKRWEYYMEPRVYPSGDLSLPSRRAEEFNRYLSEQQARSNKTRALAFSGNWTPLGPTGTQSVNYFSGAARVNFLRFQPGNPQTMWTGSPGGGLWKTTNGGNTWTTNTDQLSIIGCSDVAIDPSNPQIMYLATGDANGTNSQLWQSTIGVLKSTDGGQTWGNNTMNWQVSWNRSIYKLLIHPLHPDTVYAASSVGIYRSLNAGGSWQLVQSGAFTDMEFKPGNPSVIYAASGVQSNGTLYRSTNAGSSFSILSTGLPLPASTARMDIGVTPADSNSVYVLAVKPSTYDFQGFYQSTDGGNTFTLKSSSPNILSGLPSAQAWYNLSLAVSPLHKDTLYAGATDLYKSTDGGGTWTKISSHNGIGVPFVHPDHHALEFLPGTDSVLFSGNDGGVWKSTDRGASWTTVNGNLDIAQVYRIGNSVISPNTFLTGHQDMATHKYVSGAWAMVTQNTGDGMECLFEYDNDTIMYLGSYNGRLIKAYNTFPLFNVVCSFGGSGVNATGAWITPFVMHPQYDTVLLVGKAQVWRSTNAGQSFTQVGNVSGGATNLIALAYAPSNAKYIYAAKSNRVFVSTDGNTFTDRTAGLPTGSASITALAVSATDSNKVWVSFSGYSAGNKVWHSADAGQTWNNASTGLPNLPVNCIVYQNGSADGLYVGTDVGVYYTENGQSGWQPFFTGLPNVDVQELEINLPLGVIRAATNGRGVWQSNLATLPLPVQYLNFEVQKQGNKAVLQWSVQESERCGPYEAERRGADGQFHTLHSLPCRGEGSTVERYETTDDQPESGVNYYRIRQRDPDGRSVFSVVRSLDFSGQCSWTLHPNPAGAELQLSFSGTPQTRTLSLCSLRGEILYRTKSAGQQVSIPLMPLVRGSYLIRVQGAALDETRMFFKE